MTGPRSFCYGQKKCLYLAGLFSVESPDWSAGGLLPAVHMAMDDINLRDDILPNHNLCLIWAETKGQTALGVRNFIRLLDEPPTKIALLGSSYSTVTAVIAELSPFYNMLQISFSSESSFLANRKSFPLLFRTAYSYSKYGEAYVALLNHFNWTRVAVIGRNSYTNYQDIYRVSSAIRKSGIEVKAIELFLAETPVFERLKRIKDLDVRIIIVISLEKDMLGLACAAYKLEMYGKKYVWIIPHWYEKKFWDKISQTSKCLPEHIYAVINHALSISVLYMNYEYIETITGMTPKEQERRYLNRPLIANKTYSPNGYWPFAYDAVWSIALALNNSRNQLESLNKTFEDFNYQQSEMRKIFYQNMESVQFLGISNNVSFDYNGDVDANIFDVRQYQGDDKVKIGTIRRRNIILVAEMETSIKWIDQKPPPSADIIVDRIQPLQTIILYIMIFLCSLGYAITFLSLSFIVKHYRTRTIALIATDCAILFGSIILYTSVILMGLNDEQTRSVTCMLLPWLNCYGFALVAGSILIKSLIVYRNVTSRWFTKEIGNLHVLAGLLSLLLLESAFLISWTSIDPLKSVRVSITSNLEDDEIIPYVKYRPVVLLCKCQFGTYWLIGTIGLNGIVLLFSAFIAYEARDVRLNNEIDVRNISTCIYNTILLGLIVIPLSFVIDRKNNELYMVIGGYVIFCTTLCQLILFLLKGRKSDDKIRPSVVKRNTSETT
ncbi:uncharacterized protein TRIADDRAFT_55500 [Trichoplax adhaerens]|uniref:G-protein coupled receptors family 3 profile domain-containing protein n=1 Tax=Trichoplax adhaerens TaxID=10228 RepID=B3RV24_TRIAD|nr:hypothetical protein TRIADDRAFT_55500 [Trichoplax adhaerens]EDV25424.1 hypothetical protein TRIADDRAFT_55500 [Trichoplax adhaerens]|eukprot:XP_002111457.1 hypothetical protein TRIADDRAFT_55500 [Trichoplax adhaerens]